MNTVPLPHSSYTLGRFAAAMLLALAVLPLRPTLAQSAIAGPDQNARVQIIHNAADPTLGALDVYVNGTLTHDDLSFRSATPYFDVAAGVNATIALAPATSTSVRDALITHTLALADQETYAFIAAGVLDPAAFASNPDARPTGLTLQIQRGLPESFTNRGLLRFASAQGIPDAPLLDFRLRELGHRGRVIPPASYGDLAPPRTLPTRFFTLDVVPEGSRRPVASFEMDLTALGGQSAIVLASGFLDPSANQDGAALAILGVFPDGTVVHFPQEGSIPTTARVQIIHNAADPNLGFVDIYANGALIADDLGFRSATPFIDLPADKPLELAIAPFRSAEVNESEGAHIIADVSLQPGATAIFMISGVLGYQDFANNPDGRLPVLSVYHKSEAREVSTHPNEIQFFAWQGISDAPPLTVQTSEGVPVLTNAAYEDQTAYTALPAGNYTLTVTSDDPLPLIDTTFTLDLSTLAGASGVVLTSGFLDPEANKQGPGPAIIFVLPDGTVVELPATTIATRPLAQDGLLLHSAYPNPFNPTTSISFDLPRRAEVAIEVFDMMGRNVLALAPQWFAAGTAHRVEIDGTPLASGLYLYRLTARMRGTHQVYTGRLTLLK